MSLYRPEEATNRCRIGAIRTAAVKVLDQRFQRRVIFTVGYRPDGIVFAGDGGIEAVAFGFSNEGVECCQRRTFEVGLGRSPV